MLRVWFNHWFSTSYGIIQLLKQCNMDIYVIASNKEIKSVIQNVCDEWYPEPIGEGASYVDACLAFCIEHAIDVFVPRRNMLEISKVKKRFEMIGVQVLLDDYDKIRVLTDKAQAYAFLSDIPGINIPKYEVVNTISQFEEAYATMKKDFKSLCVKFVKDEGARSFRKIEDCISAYDALKTYRRSAIDYNSYVSALRSVGVIDDIMIMPYLEGPEISVDCLKTMDGIIAIPRFKSPSRHEEIHFDSTLLDVTKSIVARSGLEQPCNIQYRVDDGVVYLLEVNTRMSGGLQMSCLGTGVNIPQIALCKLMGQRINWHLSNDDCTVSYIETPEIIRCS